MWLDQAKQLKIGCKSRQICCGKSKSLIISHSIKGYSAHCFRCGYNGFYPVKERSLKDIARSIEEEAFENDINLKLPRDFNYIDHPSVPDIAKKWILQYGIGLALARLNCIGYSKKLHRVIIPAYDWNDKLIFLQARSLDGREPKYLNKADHSTKAIMSFGNIYHPNVSHKILIIVEDMISMIKVGQVNCSATIFGTNMTAEKAYEVASRFDRVIIWSDGDEAGECMRKQAIKQLRLQGVEYIAWIITPKDPKEYSLLEIQEEIDKIEWR